MSNTTVEQDGPGYSSLTRRDRLERIANAERDRRAGRAALAMATIGEPVEWPARAVVALAQLSASEDEPRRLLEEGLDLWARESGLGELDEVAADTAQPGTEDLPSETDPLGLVSHLDSIVPDLERPFDPSELERAFDEAKADVESMHDVNDVAARVLLDESVGLPGLASDGLTPVEEPDEARAFDVEAPPDTLGMDAAFVDQSAPAMNDSLLDVACDPAALDTRQRVALATLETWLQNLEHRNAGRA